MDKIVLINTEKLEDDGFDLEFDIEAYLIDKDIRHATFRMGSQLEFSLFDVDIIIYNMFVIHLKKCNIDFIEK